MASHDTGLEPAADQGPALPPAPLTIEELDAWERRLPRTDHTACCETPSHVRRLIAQARRCAEAELRYRELAGALGADTMTPCRSDHCYRTLAARGFPFTADVLERHDSEGTPECP